MNTSLYELSNALYERYSSTPTKKRIRLTSSLSVYKSAIKKFKENRSGLSWDEVKVLLLMFASTTHNKPHLPLWEVARTLHHRPDRQAHLLSHLLSTNSPLHTDHWILIQGQWPTENQINELFTLSEYFSHLYNQNISLHAYGFYRLVHSFFPNKKGKHACSFFSIPRKPYTSSSEFLEDVEKFFSIIKFYKTSIEESTALSIPYPWYEQKPFSVILETISFNLSSEESIFHQAMQAINFEDLVMDYLNGSFTPKIEFVFFLYLVYITFIRQEPEQSIEHVFQLLAFSYEDRWDILKLFDNGIFTEYPKLIEFTPRNLFEEESEEDINTEEEIGKSVKNFISMLTSRNFQVRVAQLYALFAPHFSYYRNLFFPEEENSSQYDNTVGSSASNVDTSGCLSEEEIDLLLNSDNENNESENGENHERSAQVIVVEKKENLYEIIKPNITLNKIILDEDIKQELLNAVDMTKTMKTLRRWGVKPSLAYKDASSIKILLYGLSGTGKTITAEALAGEAHAKLFKVDAANLVSSFVGESTKNVKKVFEEYYIYVKRNRSKVFFFINEADQLLSARGQVYQAADKEYNQMQNIFLEEIENFRGVLIATTNLIELFDVAWNRRFNIKIRFDIPKYETRLKIWKVHISEKMPLAPDVDLARLAEFELAGGSIANVVYNAARKAASRQGVEQVITQKDFLEAIEKETKAQLGMSSKKVGFN
jgi:SpoVK/Ycf46/Vps4 family AAA+-type ATPase